MFSDNRIKITTSSLECFKEAISLEKIRASPFLPHGPFFYTICETLMKI